MNADNSKAGVLIKCVLCGLKYQAIVNKLRRCICGGELKPPPPKEPTK
jgi:hypothetical protein